MPFCAAARCTSALQRLLSQGISHIFEGWEIVGEGDAKQRLGVTAINAVEAANTVKASTGHATVFLLYATTCPTSRAMFPEFAEFSRRHRTRARRCLRFDR